MSIYETPKYEVLFKQGNFELRKYQAYFTSSVKESKLKGNDGFGVLFSYISGNNQANQKISMTIPVINTLEDDGMTMEFVVPAMYEEGKIPKPSNSAIKTKYYPEQLVAAISFSGRVNDNAIESKQIDLHNWINANKFKMMGPIRIARYNSPFQLPFLRRNELLVEVKYPIEEGEKK